MDQKEYLEQSERTAAAVKLHHGSFTPKEVLHEAVQITYSGMTADVLKRSLFYSDGKIVDRMQNNTTKLSDMYEKIKSLPEDFVIPEEKINFLHAFLGIASEAGEIAEEIINSIIEDRDVNIVNMEEESGDSFWYFAMMIRELAKRVPDRVIDFSTIKLKNIEKLKKRYPQRFTSEDALNRNLDEENKALNS